MLHKKYNIISASQLDTDKVDNFMEQCFSRDKCDFLKKHGSWLYNGNENRYIVLDGNTPAGYFGLIPGKINIEGKEYKTLTSMDLYVLAQYRGKGIMKTIDSYVKSKESIIISFPNKTSYKIFKKYGYAVTDKNSIMIFLIKPLLISQHKRFNIFSKFIMICLFSIIEPFLFLFLRRHNYQSTKYSYELKNPSIKVLENIFKTQAKDIVTAIRDESYIRRRFFDSPFFSQYNFFVGGSQNSQSIAIITRTLIHLGVRQTRVLDIFGNLNDKDGLLDLIRFAIKDSIKKKSAYITFHVSLSSLRSTLLKSGFFPITRSRFRCLHNSENIMQEIMEKKAHWSLSDSDNDSFD